MHLQFFGAAGEVTGSCHIVDVGGRRLLLDCGMIQGGAAPDERNRAPFPFDAAGIDAVILSHPHIDHCGRLPLLHKRGFRGAVYATAACRDLARILLMDGAAMQQRDAERENRRRSARRPQGQGRAALHRGRRARRSLGLIRPVGYGRAFEVLPGVELTFRDAGHILGSASVWLRLREGDLERRIVFSGDLGQYDSPILRDPEPGPAADLVVMESTYGDRLHRDRDATLVELGEILLHARSGRRQRRSSRRSPWDAARTCSTSSAPTSTPGTSPRGGSSSTARWRSRRRRCTGAMPNSTMRRRANCVAARASLPPLPNLTLCRTVEESMAINRIPGGAIVIAGSGMCTGGRIVHHLKHNLPRPECDVVFTRFPGRGHARPRDRRWPGRSPHPRLAGPRRRTRAHARRLLRAWRPG